jgi:hypothetical protein
MTILKDIMKIDSSTKKLREFGYVVGGVFAALGILFLLRGKAHFQYFLYPGIVLVILGFVMPGVLKPLQKVWMGFAVVMGWVMTRLLLSALYFLTITPIGLFLRLTGKDILGLKLFPKQSSYWNLRPLTPKNPADYERQF